MKTHHDDSSHRGIITSLALFLLMVAGGTGWLTWQTMTSTAPSALPSASPSPAERPPIGQQQAIPKAFPVSPFDPTLAPSSSRPSMRPEALQREHLTFAMSTNTQ